jgi:tRNA splicing endonuclease
MSKKRRKKAKEAAKAENAVKEENETIAEKEPKAEIKTEKPKKKASSIFAVDRVVTDNSPEAQELFNQSRYGTMLEDGKVQLSLLEALYLIEKGKIDVYV